MIKQRRNPNLDQTNANNTFFIVIGLLAVSLFIGFVYHRAWIGDDAYITLRTVDNFTHGFGLVWNAGERVQSYTHPLWMFLISAVYLFTHEAYFTTIFLSLIVSATTMLILLFMVARSKLFGAIGVTLLALSGAFLDYSTSGLENPLTHLLICIFAWLYFTKEKSPKHLFFLSLVTSLTIFNRQDIVLLLFPALFYSFIEIRSWKNLLWAASGQIPIIVWELFSIIYYGFLFPNTAYAKLYTSLPRQVLIEQGLHYLEATWLYDRWSIVLIVSGLLSLLFIKEKKQAITLGMGAVIYLVYVIYIGGDFMMGRFFTSPLLIAVILITRLSFSYSKLLSLGFLLVTGIFISAHASLPPWLNTNNDGQVVSFNGIADERSFYFPYTGLNSGRTWKDLPAETNWRTYGEKLKKEKKKVTVEDMIGLVGYYAGPDVYIVDQMALADPLLARLPPDHSKALRIGHFVRNIPYGYMESLESGDNRILNGKLHTYYQRLTTIIRGPIWDWHRFVYIIKANLGLYNNLLQ